MDVMHSIEARVTGVLYGEEETEHTVVYPADWWQAVKERWFPVWLLRRYPVVYKRMVMSFRVLYPDFRPKIDNQRIKVITNWKNELV